MVGVNAFWHLIESTCHLHAMLCSFFFPKHKTNNPGENRSSRDLWILILRVLFGDIGCGRIKRIYPVVLILRVSAESFFQLVYSILRISRNSIEIVKFFGYGFRPSGYNKYSFRIIYASLDGGMDDPYSQFSLADATRQANVNVR